MIKMKDSYILAISFGCLLWLIILGAIFLFLFKSCTTELYSFRQSIDEIESVEIVSTKNILDFTVVKILSENEQKALYSYYD